MAGRNANNSDTRTGETLGMPRAVHAWALGIFALLTLALIAVYLRFDNVNVWEGFRESRELRDTHYSETVYIESVFRTRANTWSNLAFVLVGLYALVLAPLDRRDAPGWLRGPDRSTPPVLTALFGLACCYLGLGSGIFHASLARWGQQLDVASMYPPILTLIAMLARRDLAARSPWARRNAPAITSGLVAVIVVAAVAFYIYKWSMSSGTVLPLHILALAIFFAADRIFWRPNGALPWLGAAFLALFAGVACRQLDVAGKFSGPDAWYQGHAIWHVLCALSLACGWQYIRSGERRPACGSRRWVRQYRASG